MFIHVSCSYNMLSVELALTLLQYIVHNLLVDLI